MKVLLNVVPQEEVVAELLDAMDRSIDRFSQDRSFDFRLVRIDRFLVPPKFVERYDDACMSYWDKKNAHPPDEAVMPLLIRTTREGSDLNDCLHYAAILYRAGDFGERARWGAYFYFRQFTMPDQPQMFVRLDCRENIIAENTILRAAAPDILLDIYGQLWLPGADRFSLPWVLAYAKREVDMEGQSAAPNELAFRIFQDFRRFRNGLGEVDALVNKAENNPEARRLLRYGWACASMPSVRPSPFPGAGQHLEKLFSELKDKNA